MSSGNTRKRAQQFGEFLGAQFRHKKSRSSSPSATSVPGPSNTSANTPDTSILVPGPLIRASASSGALAGPAHATQPPATFVQGKNESFQKAIQEYIDTLSNEDREAFESASDVMEKLGELQQSKFRTSSSLNIRMQRVQKVLQCVNRFLESIKICIQHSPQISSLAVGGLHCILTVSTLPTD